MMKKFLLIIGVLGVFTVHAQFIPQTKKVTTKFFPEMEVDMPTPAFQKDKGFTNHEELMIFLRELKEQHPDWVTIEIIGQSQKGKDIPQVTIAKPGNHDDKLRVWLQAGIHGNEPASTEGILYTMYQLLNDEEFQQVLDRMVITVVPMANIDGYEKQDRYAANGMDLNRDQTKLMVPESKILKMAFTNSKAHVAMDFHEYRPYRRDFAKLSTIGTTGYFDVMFMYSGNLNVNADLRRYTQEVFVTNAGKALDPFELRHREYVTTTDIHGEIQFNQGSVNARSSATSYALTNCISSLIEVRGVALGRTSFNRRCFTTYTVARSYLQTAYSKADEVKKMVTTAQSKYEGKAIVTSAKHIESQKIPMSDIHTNEVISIDAIVRNASNSHPKLVRDRPQAYIIMPGNDKAIENLKILGVTVTQVTQSQEVTVEAYQVKTFESEPFPYEGVYRQFITTSVAPSTITVPNGAYVVYTNQAKAGLVFEVLEPEGPNSFITFHVIPCKMGDVLPIYRYLTPQKLK